MAFWLKRMQYFNEYRYNSYTGGFIKPGEYYYEDDKTGDTITCEDYWKMKKSYMENNNPMQSRLDSADEATDYKQSLLDAETEYLENNALNITIGDKEYR